MNRTLATAILTLSATVGVTSLNAQTKATAVIPFEFHVQSQTLPAGKYQVKYLSGNDKSLYMISDEMGHTRFVGAPLLGNANPETPKLKFACYGGACSLSEIDMPGSNVSHSVVQHNDKHSVGMASMIAVRIAN